MLNQIASLLRISLVFLLACGAGLAGCSEKDGAKSPKKVEGLAKTIDLENNTFSMMVVTDKGAERELTGTVNAETKVSINGREARIDDVKPGEKVSVTGYREGADDNPKLIATRVEVTRASDKEWESSGSPATRADTPPAQPPANAPANKPSAQTPPTDLTPSANMTPMDNPTPASEDAKNQATDTIYATIRVKMEEFLIKRAELLKAGKPPSDPEIRNLEGSIMKARTYLAEIGDILEEPDPPIVVTAITPAPADAAPGRQVP